MKTVGQILRAARESRGLELARVAEDLRISVRYLTAIERDDVSELPGSFFYRSFVRQYAELLNLKDPQQCRVIAETLSASDVAAAPALEVHKSTIEVPRMTAVEGKLVSKPDYRRWAFGVVSFVAVVAACSLVFAGWQWYRTRPAETAASQPASSAPASTPAVQTSPQPTAPLQTPSELQSATGQGEPAQDSLVAGTEVSTDSALVGEGLFAPIRFTVHALESTWIRVTGDGKTLFVGLLEAKNQRSFTVNSQARMLVGNAGGLEVKWNGQQIGTIGPRGQVRVVEFTPENYQILQPPPKQAANDEDTVDLGVD
jgi:cytoskeleton protein RodZ